MIINLITFPHHCESNNEYFGKYQTSDPTTHRLKKKENNNKIYQYIKFQLKI